MTETFKSTAAARPHKNVMRHRYRTLSDQEKTDMQAIKDAGLQLHSVLTEIETRYPQASRELRLAMTKTEEAVMWGVKQVTG